jgi:F420-dependent oxidoreductase-like protein
MRFAIFSSMGNTTWADVVALWRHAEQTGWDAACVTDHFMPNTPDRVGDMLESWTTLTALAALTTRMRVGTIVSGNTYRHPAVLAKMAATIDQISGGRVILGIGGGWQENEHAAYGIDFFTVKERLARLDEACQVIKALTTHGRADFDGRYYRLVQAPLEPKPVQSPLPLLVGGGGEKVTMRIAAQYADEWNTWGMPDVLRHKMAVLDQHCAAVGRDPKEIQRSAQALLFLSDDPAFLERVRGGAGGRASIAGNVDEVRAVVAEYAEAGLDELIIPDFTLGSMDRKLATLDTFITRVASDFR